MSIPVIYRPQALDDAEEVRQRYEAQLPGLGPNSSTLLQRAIGVIQQNPRLYGVLRLRVRVAPLRHFPQLVYYKNYKSYVLIVAVQHGRRSIRGWRDRL